MDDPDARPEVPRLALDLARLLALTGGMILVAMAAITVLSISGRALVPLGLGPIRGDFELVELGCALVVFSFLPWCQVTRSHVRVDLVRPLVPAVLYRWFGWLGDLLLTGFLGLLLWRLWLGFGERLPYGSAELRQYVGFGPPPFFAETTFELQVPLWIPYLGAVLGLGLAFCVSLIMLVHTARPGARSSGIRF